MTYQKGMEKFAPWRDRHIPLHLSIVLSIELPDTKVAQLKMLILVLAGKSSHRSHIKLYIHIQICDFRSANENISFGIRKPIKRPGPQNKQRPLILG